MCLPLQAHLAHPRPPPHHDRLQQDEIDFLNTVDDLLAYAGVDPTPEEQKDGIVDQYEFQQQLRALKSESIPLWTRYGLH